LTDAPAAIVIARKLGRKLPPSGRPKMAIRAKIRVAGCKRPGKSLASRLAVAVAAVAAAAARLVGVAALNLNLAGGRSSWPATNLHLSVCAQMNFRGLELGRLH